MIKSEEFDIPVISVGNITVGGTGKTPHIEYLVRLLKNEFKVAVLSRGYKRKTENFILANANSKVDEIGDEPKQIKQKFPDIVVAVEKKRARGIRRLMQEYPDLDVILLDDAYQHRYVKPGLSILLIDHNRPISDDLILPAGQLREQSFEKRRANIILVTKCPDRLKPIERRIFVKDLKLYPFQHLFFTTLKNENPRPVFETGIIPLSRQEIKDRKPYVLMVSGIANPRSFKKHLRNISTHITEMVFPDHHEYIEKDMKRIFTSFNMIDATEKFIFTTEKDAVRFQNFTGLDPEIASRTYCLPVIVDFLNEDTNNFNQLILNYVRNNKRNSILHKK